MRLKYLIGIVIFYFFAISFFSNTFAKINSSIVVKVGNREYKQVDNIINVNKNSEIYLLQEVADEKYELFFGDGILGKKLTNGDVIKVSYITTKGSDGNGPSVFSYAGYFSERLSRYYLS